MHGLNLTQEWVSRHVIESHKSVRFEVTTTADVVVTVRVIPERIGHSVVTRKLTNAMLFGII